MIETVAPAAGHRPRRGEILIETTPRKDSGGRRGGQVANLEPGPTQQKRDRDPRLRNACAACGNQADSRDPLELTNTRAGVRDGVDGPLRVHRSHITDPGSGLHEPGRRFSR
jgi:hypothetical protein